MENNETKNPEEIKETELTTVKTPWWKIVLKVGGYMLSAVGGVVVGLLVGGHDAGDDEEAPAEDTQE